MKKRALFISIGMIIYFTLMVFIRAYENKLMHTSINDAIVNWFWYKSNDNYGLKNVDLKFGEGSVEGQKISTGGIFDFTESKASMTPKEWIVHGGYSCDVPEYRASLRHFYDPVKIDGVSYLTDLVEGIMTYYGQPLPKMDAKEWAISATDNPYNWTYAKQYLGNALYSETQRNYYLSSSYRALGEVLHLFADMGCPPHVRNDAHPSFVSGKFGDPDPYEELIKSAQVLDYGSDNIQPDAVCATQFKSAIKAENIFEVMAQFTNKNFFSEDTQYGNGITPHINDRMPYTSPAVGADVIYNASDKYYYKTINGKQIKMLVAKSYFFGEKYSTMDLQCIKSQASVLIPTIIEGGANIMRLFIPEISITISDAKDDGSLNATVYHKVNSEYTKEIKYNGKIKIYKGSTLVGEATCINNVVSGSGLNIKKDEIITAQLEIPGLYFKSGEFKVKEKTSTLDCLSGLKACTKFDVSINYNATFSDGTSENNKWTSLPAGNLSTANSFNDALTKWSGNNFLREKKMINDGSVSVDTTYCRMSGTLSADGNTIEFLSVEWYRHYKLPTTNPISEEIGYYGFQFVNIPLTICDQYNKKFIIENDTNINSHAVAGYTYYYRYEKSTNLNINRELKSASLIKIQVSFW